MAGRRGYPIAVISVEGRHRYSKALKRSQGDEADLSPLTMLMAQYIEKGLAEYEAAVK